MRSRLEELRRVFVPFRRREHRPRHRRDDSRLIARMREQVREVPARESVLGDELVDEGARLGALVVAQRRDAFRRRGIERRREQDRQRRTASTGERRAPLRRASRRPAARAAQARPWRLAQGTRSCAANVIIRAPSAWHSSSGVFERPSPMLYPLFRPLLFTLDPETAHDVAFVALDAAVAGGAAQLTAPRVAASPVGGDGPRISQPRRTCRGAGQERSAYRRPGNARIRIHRMRHGDAARRSRATQSRACSACPRPRR